MNLSLENIESYEDITENNKVVLEIGRIAEKLGVRIDDDGKNSLEKQIRNRKEELEQLLVLLT